MKHGWHVGGALFLVACSSDPAPAPRDAAVDQAPVDAARGDAAPVDGTDPDGPTRDGGCAVTCTTVPHAVRFCMGETCVMNCRAGFADCDGDPVSGCEAELASSRAHCGRCGNACGAMPCAMGRCGCAPPRTACENACVDLGEDRLHCGDCQRACPGDAACNSGVCVCSGRRTVCPGLGCRDLSTDPAHCGICHQACAMGQRCVDGRCT